MTRTLAVLARAPVAGRAKTRMIPALGAEGAAALQQACIDVIVERPWPVDRRVLWVTDGDAVWDRARATGWIVKTQPIGGLDVRIAAALDDATESGVAMVIGTDSPDLPEQLVQSALADVEADAACVHLVPTIDGGFALIAAAQPVRSALRPVAWSAPTTLLDTVEALRAVQRSVRLGGYWYDLDEVADLRRLWVHSKCASSGLVPYFPAAKLARLSVFAAPMSLPLGERDPQ